MSSKIIDGSGDHNGENRQSAFPVVDLPDTVSKLKSEIARQETLILAYQKENEKLYGQLKAAQVSKSCKKVSIFRKLRCGIIYLM